MERRTILRHYGTRILSPRNRWGTLNWDIVALAIKSRPDRTPDERNIHIDRVRFDTRDTYMPKLTLLNVAQNLNYRHLITLT